MKVIKENEKDIIYLDDGEELEKLKEYNKNNNL